MTSNLDDISDFLEEELADWFIANITHRDVKEDMRRVSVKK